MSRRGGPCDSDRSEWLMQNRSTTRRTARSQARSPKWTMISWCITRTKKTFGKSDPRKLTAGELLRQRRLERDPAEAARAVAHASTTAETAHVVKFHERGRAETQLEAFEAARRAGQARVLEARETWRGLKQEAEQVEAG